MRKNMQQETS